MANKNIWLTVLALAGLGGGAAVWQSQKSEPVSPAPQPDAAVKETELQLLTSLQTIYEQNHPRMIMGQQTKEQHERFVSDVAEVKNKLVKGHGYTPVNADIAASQIAAEVKNRVMESLRIPAVQPVAEPQPQLQSITINNVTIPFNVIGECLKAVDSPVINDSLRSKFTERLEQIKNELEQQGLDISIRKEDGVTRFGYRQKGSTERYADIFVNPTPNRGPSF